MGLDHHGSAAPGAQPGDARPWPNPIGDGFWIDDDGGVRWHLRGRRGGGTPLSPPALRRLLKRADLRVLHAYGPQPTEVSGPDREALLMRVAQYFAGQAPAHSAFLLAEFRNEARQVMLVVQEFC